MAKERDHLSMFDLFPLLIDGRGSVGRHPRCCSYHKDAS
jgi:hypothetical protein